ncbi:hypothetical protein QN386_08920, partial [Pseudomonas sp. CCI3.2]|uniref:hypothetical protein n=1 Tax=Pseudomonas sp. CCI3.2 TaxID=3048619 RepID=UPI002B232B6E
RGKDAEKAVRGQGRPLTATPGATPELGTTEPKRRPAWWGKRFGLPFCGSAFRRLKKVTRCKSETIISATTKAGYTLKIHCF